MTSPLEIHTVLSKPFQENTYIVWQKGRKDALVIDPGLEPELILDFLHHQDLTPAAILNTHGHGDHIGGNADLKQAYPDAPLIIGINEVSLLSDPEANMSAPFGWPISVLPRINSSMKVMSSILPAFDWKCWKSLDIHPDTSCLSMSPGRRLSSAVMFFFGTAWVDSISRMGMDHFCFAAFATSYFDCRRTPLFIRAMAR